MTQTPSSTSSPLGPTSPEVLEQQDRKAKREHAIQEMEKHLSVAHDGTVVLGVKSAAEIQVDPDAFAELIKSLQELNVLLQTHQLSPSQVRLKTNFAASEPATEAIITAAGTCAGVDSFTFNWWGILFRIDECVTTALEGALQAGAGTAGIFAVLNAAVPPAAFAWGMAAAIAGLTAGIIQAVDGICGQRGVAFHITWLLVVSWVWCS